MGRSRPLPGWLDASLLVALAFFLLEVAFAYPPAVVEADSVRVGYGIIHGAHTEQYFRARDLYGRSFSFGYYALFWAIYPRLYAAFTALGAAMNGLNLLATALSLIVFHRWVKVLWGGPVALAAMVLVAATPVVFELGGYGHPEGPAFLALNLGIWILVRAMSPDTSRRASALVGATVLTWAAACLRADVILGFPALPFLAAAGSPHGLRARGWVLGALTAGIAVMGFFACQSAVLALAPPRALPVSGANFTGSIGTAGMLLEYWKGATSVQALAKGGAVWMTGLGPVLLALGGLGVWALFRRGQTPLGLAALAWILPSAIFWLPNPTPSRHLLLTFLGLVPAAGYWLATRFPGRRFAAAVLLTLALNVFAMDSIRPLIVQSYRFAFVSLLPRRVNLWVPMGNPIAARVWARRLVRLELEETRQLVETTEPRVFVFGGWVALRLIHELYARGDYRVEYEWRHEAFLVHVTTPKTEYVIYEYAGPPALPPAELMQRIAAAGEYRDFALAIVPSDQPVVGGASVPAGYQELPIVLPPALTRR